MKFWRNFEIFLEERDRGMKMSGKEVARKEKEKKKRKKGGVVKKMVKCV